MEQSPEEYWLLKVPTYVVDTWRGLSPDVELGQVIIDQSRLDDNQRPVMHLRVNPGPDKPLEPDWLLQTRPIAADSPQLVFFDSAQHPTSKVRMSGKIDCTMDARPVDLELRLQKADQLPETFQTHEPRLKLVGGTPARAVGQTMFVPGTHKLPVTKITRIDNTATLSLSRPKMEKINRQKDKRVRIEKPQLQTLLFSLFEKKPHWSMKELVTETEQPQRFLKEVLDEMGTYSTKGDNMFTWSLKQ